MKKQSGLGRGLGALLDDPNLDFTGKNGSVTSVPLHRVEPNPFQPRKEFDPEALQTLADSIAEHGMIQPLTVREVPGGYYQIIAGERRWRAARLAGLEEVPVLVMEADDRRVMELALVENLQREDLNPMEDAAGYRKLIDDYGLTQEEVSARVQKSRSAVANALRLLGLDQALQKMVTEGSLSAGHARALLPLKDEKLREKAAKEVVSRGLNVRQTEALAATLLRQPPEKPEKPLVGYVKEAEKQLSDILGRGVKFVGGQKKGKIQLEFYSADDREALMDALKKMDKPWKNTTKQ